MRQFVLASLGVLICVALLGCEVESDAPSRPLASEPGFDGVGTIFKPTSEAAEGSSRLVYVPVYSRLFLSDASYWELAASLSIRNTDPSQSVTVYEIDYFDTAGNLLQQYLETPHELAPMATVTLTLPQSDVRGGAGANFLVRWSGGNDVNEPIIEVVMAGIRGTQSFSFIRTGQEIVE